MLRSIQIACVGLLLASCSPEVGPPHRGDDGRTGDFGAAGVADLDQIVWKHRAKAAASGPVALGDGVAYLLTTDGVLTALELHDGSVRWETALETSAYGTPVIAGKRVLVGTDAGLVAVGLDGEQQWRNDGSAIETAPIVIDAVAYVGDIDGRVTAIDVVGGTLIWEAITAGPIRADLVTTGADVVAGSADGGVYSLDPATGEPRWTWSGSAAVRGLSATDDRIFVAAGTEVVAINVAEPEAAAWRADVGAVVETPPSLTGGQVVVGTGTGLLVGLDTTDGTQLFQTDVKAPIRGAIAVTKDRLVLPATRSGIEVVDRAGKTVWHFRTDGLVVGAIPMNQRLFVTDAAGSVYALK